MKTLNGLNLCEVARSDSMSEKVQAGVDAFETLVVNLNQTVEDLPKINDMLKESLAAEPELPEGYVLVEQVWLDKITSDVEAIGFDCMDPNDVWQLPLDDVESALGDIDADFEEVKAAISDAQDTIADLKTWTSLKQLEVKLQRKALESLEVDQPEDVLHRLVNQFNGHEGK